jgi:hypothetical protein
MVKKTYHQFFRTPRSRDNHFSHWTTGLFV